MRQITLRIGGMSCGHCLNAVNAALRGVPGVEIGSVQMGRAEVTYDESRVEEGRIIEAVREAGYEATT